MISTPPRVVVIQSSMARISSFYHASATAPLANHSDFFNTYACLRQSITRKVLRYWAANTGVNAFTTLTLIEAAFFALFKTNREPAG
jgi:hypothetical protein